MQKLLVDPLAGLLAEKQVGELRRPRQAAAMGGQDAVTAGEQLNIFLWRMILSENRFPLFGVML
jgi:hypothetical protein